MQNADRFRQFAETLIAAAEGFEASTRQAILSAAAAWTALADAEDGVVDDRLVLAGAEDAPAPSNIVSFEAVRRRQG